MVIIVTAGLGNIDLHVHSNKSDGNNDVASIIEMALANNVTTMAFAEHYNFNSYVLANKIAKGKIEIIPAIELGTDMTKLAYKRSSKCHILVYYPNQPEMYKILDQYELARKAYVKQILKKLQYMGFEIDLESIKKYARDAETIGRYDVATTLVKLRIARNIDEAYDKFLNYRDKTSIQREKPDPISLLKQISKIGGVPVLAHPNSLSMIMPNDIKKEQEQIFRGFIEKLIEAGLKGIECRNSYMNPNASNFYFKIAREYGLLTTCGSDYHGRKNDKIVIGKGINNNMCIKDHTIIEKLKEAAKVK